MSHALETQLTTLETSGLIRAADVEPELEYLFRHALIQDAAYESLLKSDRRVLHRAVAETLEQLYPDQHDELAAVLALHFAAAQDQPKAIAYYRRAAQHAVGRYAYEEGLQHLEAALDLLPSGPNETRAALLEELADLHQLIRNGKQAVTLYQAALEQWASLAANAADSEIALRLHRKILETFPNMLIGGQFEQVQAMAPIMEHSQASLKAGVSKAETQSPRLETVRQLIALSRDAWLTSFRFEEVDLERGEQFARAAVQLAEQLNAPQELAAALEALAGVHYAHNQLREHLDLTLRRLALSREAQFNDLRGQVNVLGSVASAFVYVGEYQQAVPYTLEAEILSDRIRAVFWRVQALGVQSQCAFRLDRWDDMLRIADKRAELEKQYPREQVGFTCFEIGLTATIHALRGEMELARQLREQAYRIMVGGDTPDPNNWARNQHY